MTSFPTVPLRNSVKAAIVSLVAAMLLGLTPFETRAVSDSVESGAATIVDPIRQSVDLTHGNATTPFSLRLPDGATCPGDSANDQWRVQTFMLPAEADPAAVVYGPIGPDPTGNGRYALFDVDTTPFVHELTVRNPAAGDPGIIPVLPSFDLSVVEGEALPAGGYQLGVACTYFGATKKVWVAKIVVTVVDGKLGWRLPGVPESVNEPQQSSGLATIVVFAFVGAALAALLIWRQRSSRRVNTLSKELQ